jgi:hypothetical protein
MVKNVVLVNAINTNRKNRPKIKNLPKPAGSCGLGFLLNDIYVLF